MYEELISGNEVVDLAPSQALDKAEYFLMKIKVRSNDGEGLQGRQGLWKLWTENLPKRRP